MFDSFYLMTKILLLGLGRWGANHLRNLNNLPIELYVAEVGDKQLEPARKLGLPEKDGAVMICGTWLKPIQG